MSRSYCLGDIQQIPEGGSKGFQLGNQSLFVVRQQERCFVYRNSCPHLGIELEWMPDQFLDPPRHFIQCSTHGALFLIESGECDSGPCLGDFLERIPSRIQDGQLWIELES